MKRVLSLIIVLVMIIPTFAFALAPNELKVYSRKEIPLSITYGLENVTDAYLASGLISRDSKLYGAIVKIDLDGTVLNKYEGKEGIMFSPVEYDGKYFAVYIDSTNSNKVVLLQFNKELELEKEYTSDLIVPGLTVISGVLNGNIYITSPNTNGEIVGVKKDATTSDAGVLNLRTGEIRLASAAEVPDFVKKIKASHADIAGIPYGYAENSKYFLTFGPNSHATTGGHYLSIYNKTTSAYDRSFNSASSSFEYQDGDLLDDYFYVVSTNTATVGVLNMETRDETAIDLKSFYTQDVVSLMRINNTTDGLIIADLACVGSTGKCTSGIIFLKSSEGIEKINKYVEEKAARINGKSNNTNNTTSSKASENPATGVFTHITEVAVIIAVCLGAFVVVRKNKKFKNI